MLKQLVLIATIFAVIGCSKGVNQETEPPGKPVILKPPDETTTSDRGNGAIPEADWIRVEWLVGSEPDLSGYQVYRREEGEALDSLMISLPLQEVTKDTAFWNDRGAEFFKRYQYYVRAFDESGNLSVPSDTVDFELLPKPVPESPQSQETVRDSVPRFLFGWGQGGDRINSFVIRVASPETGYLWISKPSTFEIIDFGIRSETLYNSDGQATTPYLAPGSYKWRVDAIGGQRSGSKSRWVNFRVSK